MKDKAWASKSFYLSEMMKRRKKSGAGASDVERAYEE